MPKKKSKKVTAEAQADIPDDASVASLTSDGIESLSGALEADDEVAVLTVVEKLSKAVDLIGEKRPETRIKALQATINYLRLGFLQLDSISWNYTETFLNNLEFVFKKGRTQDRILAAECLAVMTTQYDPEEMPIWLERFKSLLEVILRDAGEPVLLRGKCALALASLCFFSNCDNFIFVLQFMDNLEAVFRGSCPKGDGKTPILAPEIVTFHLNALQAWKLMLVLLPSRDVQRLSSTVMPCMVGLLKGSSVDMKIAAGGAIAIIYERIRSELNSSFRGNNYKELAILFNDLCTDCDKSRSKDDRKRQRQSFRDIMSSVLDDDCPEETIRFGKESITIMSCTYHFYYEYLCDVLSGGIHHHLRFNLCLRELFDLGPPRPSEPTSGGARNERGNAKSRRNYENQCAFKIRTQALNVRREKRSNMLAAEEDY